jgi:rubrerythrin
MNPDLKAFYLNNIQRTGSAWLLQWFMHRIEQNRNVIGIFSGEPGSGKSFSAIRLAQLVDPGFDVARVVFTVNDVLHLINGNVPVGSVIIFDDAGLNINAREWQNAQSKLFGMLTQGFRYKQIILLLTVPDESFIEAQSRKLTKIAFEATSVQGTMKIKITSKNSFDPYRPLHRYPTLHRGWDDIKVKKVKFRLPEEAIISEYEKKKEEYMQSTFQEFESRLNGQTPDDPDEALVIKNEKPAVHIECGACGYGWDYSGKLKSAKCPNCGRRNNVVEGGDVNHGVEMICTNPKCEHKWNYTGEQKETRCPKCGKHVSVGGDI